MLRAARMKRFYLAVLQKHEDVVADLLGSLGIVHLEKEKSEIGREVLEAEEYSRFIRNFDRLNTLLDTIEKYIGRKEISIKGLSKFKGLFVSPPPKYPLARKITRDEFKKILNEIEKKTDQYNNEVDDLTKKLNDINKLKQDLEYFKRNKLKLDIIGEYTHIIVKAGFIPIINITKLSEYLRPFNVVYSILEGRPKENLVIIAASVKDKEEINKILTLLNFEEFKLPEGLDPDPEKAIMQLEKEENKIIDMLKELKENVKKDIQEYSSVIRYIRFLHKVKSSILRTRNLTLFDGWIPANKTKILEEKVKEVTEGLLYLQFRDPEEGEEPPTYIHHPPILNKFELLTFKQGTPNYNEINPTPIYTVLFIIMYGIMFGDIGQGIILFILGLFLYKIKKPLLGISASGINKLGAILSVSAISSIIFGFLYGEAFLFHVFKEPLWLNPIDNIMDIILFSIIFGLLQIIVGIVLNIINLLLHKEYLHAIFSWKGIVGLIYYITGIYLAIKFVTGGFTFSVFLYPENLPFLIITLITLALMFFSPAIVTILSGEREEPLSTSIMMGFGEFLEGFISYLTNSISYVRLGAFAVAHVALGETAAILSLSIGMVTAYLFMNVLVIILEGFAAGVQSLRLIYYEFSTKFYINGGRTFKPLRI